MRSNRKEIEQLYKQQKVKEKARDLKLRAAEDGVKKRHETSQRRIKRKSDAVLDATKECNKLLKEQSVAEAVRSAAHDKARKACKRLGMAFARGVTTRDAIKAEVIPNPDQAARDEKLPFGLGFESKLLNVLGWLMIVPCIVFISIEFGLMMGGITLQGGSGIKIHALTMIGAVAVAASIGVGIQLIFRRLWRWIGTRCALRTLTPAIWAGPALFTFVIAAGFTAVDAYVIHQLSAQDPETAITTWICALIGFLISGVYIGTSVVASFQAGYHPEARAIAKRRQEDVWDQKLSTDPDIAEAVESVARYEQAEQALAECEGKLRDIQIQIEKLHSEVEELMEGAPKLDCEDYLPHEIEEIKQLDKEIEYLQETIDAIYTAMIDGDGDTA